MILRTYWNHQIMNLRSFIQKDFFSKVLQLKLPQMEVTILIHSKAFLKSNQPSLQVTIQLSSVRKISNRNIGLKSGCNKILRDYSNRVLHHNPSVLIYVAKFKFVAYSTFYVVFKYINFI